MSNYKFLSLMFVFPFWGMAQNNPVQDSLRLSMLVFVDTYYVYDFNRPAGPYRQEFFFNHNRHNETNLNLGLVQFSLEHPRYRAHLGLQTGTYVIDNYQGEDESARMIHQANVGIAIDKKQRLWLDAGILPSHIGFESALSTANPTLTRSLSAENSPYFLTGVRLSYIRNRSWNFAALVVNGWQRIQKVEGSSIPALATQVSYQHGDFTLNWSTLMGSEFPDAERKMRYFNNFYVTQKLGKLSLFAGFDIGWQQTAKDSSMYECWYTPTLIGHYRLSPQLAMALRGEYYHDPKGVVVHPNPTQAGFKSFGGSLNVDYQAFPNFYLRTEARYLGSSTAYFKAGPTSFKSSDFFIGFSMAYQWQRKL